MCPVMSLELISPYEACSTLLLGTDEGSDAHVVPDVSQEMMLPGKSLAAVDKVANVSVSIGKLLAVRSNMTI